MKKIMLTLLLGIFLISFASAEIQTLGTFKLGENISLIQTCSNCTFNNITSLIQVSPISKEIIGNFPMTKIGTVYNFTLSSGNITEIGEYIVNGIGDLNGIDDTWNYNFFVTKTGFILETSESNLIFALLIVLLILTFSFFYLASINLTEAPWLNFPLKLGGLLLGFVMTYSVLRIVRNLARDLVKSEYLGAPLNILLKLMSIMIPIIFLIAAGVIVFDILLSLRIETEKVFKK